jgi:hypothetical protein
MAKPTFDVVLNVGLLGVTPGPQAGKRDHDAQRGKDEPVGERYHLHRLPSFAAALACLVRAYSLLMWSAPQCPAP